MQKTNRKNERETVNALKQNLGLRAKAPEIPQSVEPPPALKRAIRGSNTNERGEGRRLKPGPVGNGIEHQKYSNFASDVYNYNRLKKITQMTDQTKHALLTELLDMWEAKHGKLDVPKS